MNFLRHEIIFQNNSLTITRLTDTVTGKVNYSVKCDKTGDTKNEILSLLKSLKEKEKLQLIINSYCKENNIY
jgi:hypothetical protein